MPTFTAIALDRLLEPGASKHVGKAVTTSVSLPNSRKLDRTTSVPTAKNKIPPRPPLKPALYTTPEVTPLPDLPSSSSFPPSPYIINHKRRGPRLLKSASQPSVLSEKTALDDGKVSNKSSDNVVTAGDLEVRVTNPEPEKEEYKNGVYDGGLNNSNSGGGLSSSNTGGLNSSNGGGRNSGNGGGCNSGNDGGRNSSNGGGHNSSNGGGHNSSNGGGRNSSNGGGHNSSNGGGHNSSNGGGHNSSNGGGLGNVHRETGNGRIANGLHMENVPSFNLERDGEIDDFFDPQESMSFTSNTDGEENAGTEISMKFSSPGGEFYDAWEELSSESGTQNSRYDVEAELCETRLSLLMEIEKRKQAEESFNNMRRQWESIRQALYHAGITLPVNLIAVAKDEKPNSDVVEDLYQQVHVARFISNAIGRGSVRAELEMEMEAQLESKNFEIARLLDRLHYYETMNREMSQRNQEAVETARRERQRIKKRQRWIWGSITTVMALGTAAIAWSYLPVGKVSSCADHDVLPEHDDAPN